MSKKIIIKTESLDDMKLIEDGIHSHLIGNEDYISSKIILNGSDDRLDGSINEIHIILDDTVNLYEVLKWKKLDGRNEEKILIAGFAGSNNEFKEYLKNMKEDYNERR